MYKVAYLLPFGTVLVMLAMRQDLQHWWIYLIMLVCAELLLWLIRFIFNRHSDTEFLSGYVMSVHHEFPWVERVERHETVYDSKGNAHTKVRVDYVRHPDAWYWVLNTGRRDGISHSTFEHMCLLFGTGRQFECVSHVNCVSGGDGEYCVWNGNEYDTQTVTYKHPYVNPIKNSHSIFNTSKITKERAKELGLYRYPKIKGWDQEVVRSGDHFEWRQDFQEVLAAFQRLNAFCGINHQIHVYVLIFDANLHGVEIVESQRAYWEGGNKNEFVVCLGVEGADKVVWSHSFSWMDFDAPSLSVATRSYFIEHPNLDLLAFASWLRNNLDKWKRKEAKDFKYLGVNLSNVQTFFFMLIAVAFSAIIVWITVKCMRGC